MWWISIAQKPSGRDGHRPPAASPRREETDLASLRVALQRRKLRLLLVARQEIWRNFSNVCRCIDEEVTESLRQAPPDTSL